LSSVKASVVGVTSVVDAAQSTDSSSAPAAILSSLEQPAATGPSASTVTASTYETTKGVERILVSFSPYSLRDRSLSHMER
jgi:hypothetical protein